MTQGQLTERVEIVLRNIDQQLGALVAGQEAQGRELKEIKERVKETNGRVTALEAAEIEERAALRERRRIDEETGATVRESKDRREKLRDRLIGAGVTLIGVAVGAILADIRFF